MLWPGRSIQKTARWVKLHSIVDDGPRLFSIATSCLDAASSSSSFQ